MTRARAVVLGICLSAAGLLGFAFSVNVFSGPGSDPCVSPDYREHSKAWLARSWELYGQRDYQGAADNVNACIELWAPSVAAAQADKACASDAERAQQQEMLDIPMLNEVAASYWILGRSMEKLGERDAAREVYAACARFTCAGIWDPRGRTWRPASDCAGYLEQVK